MLLFCDCGSDRVTVVRWDKGRGLFRCLSCEMERWIEGFTVAEFDFIGFLWGAVLDQARKHRHRDPAIIDRMRKKREADRKAALRR